jgi:3-methyladenine DNA glycosylase AlkC
MKDNLDARAVQCIAANLAKPRGGFRAKRFITAATAGLDALELKARVHHIIEALHESLPQPFPKAAGLLRAARSTWEVDEPTAMSGFLAWPVIDYVGVYGLEHPELALETLRELTGLFSAEFAVRPFIEEYEKQTLKTLSSWRSSDDEHVRRLISEGTRPRLPWGQRLRAIQANPQKTLPLLRALRDDESLYVRRSVANHLNDIAKDHPDLVAEVLANWSKGAKENRQWLIRHAARTLIKAGHPGGLRALGFDNELPLSWGTLKLSATSLRLGESLHFEMTLRSKAKVEAPVVVDYVVKHVKADGSLSPKVFKLKTLRLAPGERVELSKKHSFAPINTRRYYSGTHEIVMQANGRPGPSAKFTLKV